MADLLKNVYSPKFISLFSSYLERELPHFSRKEFEAKVFSPGWEDLELKGRMHHIAHVMHPYLSPDYETATQQLISIIDLHRREHSNGFNFEFMFFPEYIRFYGIGHYDLSVKAIEKITQFTSCEFVVRYFLNEYPDNMVKQMQNWAKHPHHYVRRLASEGLRTKLPWAIKVPQLSANPDLIFPVLHQLITDESDWVRKSVSNSLNDLSKDYEEQVHEFTSKWINHSADVNKVLKHGNRTLLKQGNLKTLGFFNISEAGHLALKEFSLEKKQIPVGDKLHFKIRIANEKPEETSILRLEYRLYFLRQNGTYHAKTFKILEKSTQNIQEINVDKYHNFKEITTRTYYSGKHYISLIVNGKEMEKSEFLIL